MVEVCCLPCPQMRGILGTLICHLWTCATRRILNSLLISCLEQNGREAISSFPGDCRDRATPACWLSRGVPFTSIDYLPGGREIKAVSTCPRNSGCSELLAPSTKPCQNEPLAKLPSRYDLRQGTTSQAAEKGWISSKNNQGASLRG